MTAEEFLRQGQLPECLAALQAQVRQDPAKPELRVFLFQLLAVMGQWERALNQVNVASEMDPKCAVLAQMYAPALQSEALRAQVFAGERTPVIFGEPEPWMGMLIEANRLTGSGQFRAGEEMRSRALDEAPATAGSIDGRPFEWIADADARLGPMLELILNGKYYWVPFARIRALHLDEPTDLRDVVWLPAQIQWSNGGEAVALVPVRYPGTESSDDSALRLGRKTDWLQRGENLTAGIGQRLLATDADDSPLLATRTILFGDAATAAADSGAAAGNGNATDGNADHA
jgi:type VI secretion system protein ImpE